MSEGSALLGNKHMRQVYLFNGQQFDFFINAPRKSGQAPAASYDPESRHNNGDWVAANGPAHSPGGHFAASILLRKDPRDFAIGHCPAIGNAF